MNHPTAAPKRGAAGAEKVAVIGFMGAGKSTAVRSLAGGGADVDRTIEQRSGRRVPEIFAQDGEGAFRELEERVTLELLADPGIRAVALGAGALRSQPIRRALSGVCVVWLDVELDLAWERVGSGRNLARPLARDRRQFERLYHERRPLYEELADTVVPATRAPELVRVLNALDGLGPKRARVLWATAQSGDYPVYIGPGLIGKLGFWPSAVGGRRVVISDHNVEAHYGDAFQPRLARIAITPGERSKSLAQAERIWTEMVAHGVTRGDVVVALGGGVVGDLAGFCGAAYQRGMRVVQVPTSLVAQVDSAYGGKTGVDLPAAKNYVGAFHQPAAVITDTDTLRTLPREELAAGYAEVVKTGLLAGGALWELVRGGAAPSDPRVIAGCVLTKLRIVAADERDAGRRQLLNLGHTVGHALETVTAYSRYRHGEAVALGLLVALALSGAAALRSEVAGLLAAGGLPTVLDEDVDIDQVIEAT
ncbi:MAG: bifunctional shikimate kinase/3-dehydroquinate synthase, partial [Solirubrobacteraceae bacterium]